MKFSYSLVIVGSLICSRSWATTLESPQPQPQPQTQTANEAAEPSDADNANDDNEPPAPRVKFMICGIPVFEAEYNLTGEHQVSPKINIDDWLEAEAAKIAHLSPLQYELKSAEADGRTYAQCTTRFMGKKYQAVVYSFDDVKENFAYLFSR